MTQQTSQPGTINWRAPLYAAIGAGAVCLPIIVCYSDIVLILYALVIAPSIVFFVLLIIAIRRKPGQFLSALLAALAFAVVTYTLFKNEGAIRPRIRWLLWSSRFKTELLAAPESVDASLRHMEWDGWGFAGSDTVEYLVLDPTDSLSGAARKHAAGKFPGISCDVPLVRRLESHWYYVVFYTDTDWNHCP